MKLNTAKNKFKMLSIFKVLEVLNKQNFLPISLDSNSLNLAISKIEWPKISGLSSYELELEMKEFKSWEELK
jgi:hypothetical protein